MTYCRDIEKLVRIDWTCVGLYSREGDGQITPSGVSKTEIRHAIGRWRGTINFSYIFHANLDSDADISWRRGEVHFL
jgi:hypothetical protein